MFNLNDSINDMTVLLRRSLRESISLDLVLSDEDPHIEMDRSQVEQILLNLTVNARRPMTGGGDLMFPHRCHFALGERSRSGAGRAGRVRESSEPPIQARGCTPEVRRRVFEPFFTTKERGAGTGLGLATVYGIVLGAKGGIVVDSEVDNGTTVDIFLPLVSQGPNEDVNPRKREGLAKTAASSSSMIEVGVVGPSFSASLRREGLSRHCAGGKEALAISGDANLDPWAVISDVVMPNRVGARAGRATSVTATRSPGPVHLRIRRGRAGGPWFGSRGSVRW